jgi:hypothetical protein
LSDQKSPIFILGSGFSNALSEEIIDINNRMPVTSKLGELIRDNMPRTSRYGSDVEAENAMYSVSKDNIELWMGYLAQNQPWLDESTNLRNKALFINLTEAIRKILIEKQNKIAFGGRFPSWAARLIHYWDTNKSPILSFNYDTLVEHLYMKILGGRDENDIYAFPLQKIGNKYGNFETLSSAGETFHREGLKLYKLHGSVNWFYPQNKTDDAYYENMNLPKVATINTIVDSTPIEKMGFIPLIIPPLVSKGDYYNSNVIRILWNLAGQVFFDGRDIYCIGYSFSDTDYLAQIFINSVSNVSGGILPKLVIVNNKKGIDLKIKEKFEHHYQVKQLDTTDPIGEMIRELGIP